MKAAALAARGLALGALAFPADAVADERLPPGLAAGGSALTLPVPPVGRPLLETPRDPGGELLGGDWLLDPDRRPALGPHFDATSCGGCHVELEPASGQRPVRVARLLDPAAVGVFGAQLNRRASPGLAPQGTVTVRRRQHQGAFADGERYVLRRPEVTARTAQGESLTVRLRSAPALFGWGLLEAVPDATLSAVADPSDRNGDGLSGRRGRAVSGAPGRFGWRAQVASLRAQISAALHHDMGVGTAALPDAGCVRVPRRPAAGDAGCDLSNPAAGIELSEPALDALTATVARLGVPARRDRTDPQVRRGEWLFGETGCSGCHVPAQRTGEHEDPALARQTIWPYSDLLLHDMGPGLAEPGEAGAEWRTAPLWGLGLMLERYPGRGLLHDGRAGSALEAVLWHGGEAAAARARVLALDREERRALVAFLGSL